MDFLYIVVLGVIGLIGVVVYKFARASTPSGFATGLARAQLRSLRMLLRGSPGVPRDELYVRVIQDRPGYGRQLAESLVKDARDIDLQVGDKVRFATVVLQLAAYEYLSRTGNSPMPVMAQLRAAVARVIPSDL